ncbi:uncharacterized protein LOC107610689 [Arachis ipaensis]|uniref:uncharacterized protein LOC107610689 n=1 Tax=Arachis ipaensis TaxID=130454 RepID=UPI0007AFD07A|nr:uncharacterized protein LOC107610689 [Arachis ipaensis]
MPVVAPGCLLATPSLVLAPATRSPGLITGLVGGGEPDHVEDAMRKDDSDDESDHISGDSEEETPVAPPAPQGPSSSGSHQQPPHFSILNLEAVSQQPDEAHTFGGQGLHEDNTSEEFQIGQSFQTKEEAVMSVKDYSIRRGVQNRVMESDHLKVDTAVTIKVLQEATKSTYGFRPSYRKVWKAKQKAVAQIYGDWEESYAKLPQWILGMQATMDGTVALLKTSLVRVGDRVDESTEYFQRLFWTSPPCVKAFKYCKPLISIDGTHLYGKYGGTLLLAIAQDRNSNILPVAFALVEGENGESWAFILSHLRQHVTPQEGILVISNRHNDTKAALEAPDSGWQPPHAYRAYCIRHVAANFALSFKGQDARQMLANAAYAKTEAEFDY